MEQDGLFSVRSVEGIYKGEHVVVFDTPLARNSDPATSWHAAGSVRNVTDTHRRILDLLAAFGPDHDEGLLSTWSLMQGAEPDAWPHISPSGLRSRRAELVRGGLVQDTGERHKTKSGRATIVWALTDAGWEALR